MQNVLSGNTAGDSITHRTCDYSDKSTNLGDEGIRVGPIDPVSIEYRDHPLTTGQVEMKLPRPRPFLFAAPRRRSPDPVFALRMRLLDLVIAADPTHVLSERCFSHIGYQLGALTSDPEPDS